MIWLPFGALCTALVARGSRVANNLRFAKHLPLCAIACNWCVWRSRAALRVHCSVLPLASHKSNCRAKLFSFAGCDSASCANALLSLLPPQLSIRCCSSEKSNVCIVRWPSAGRFGIQAAVATI